MKDFTSYALIVGRFQPLHNGHMEIIRRCAAEADHLNIGIGSAQSSHMTDNPFTAGERYLMLESTLRDEGISNFSIIPIEDLNRYSAWVAHVKAMCPPFSVVYSNNPFTRRLFTEAGYTVRSVPMYNRDIYSGTEVRRRMISGDDWRSLVPPAVAEVVDSIDGVGRLRDISQTDTPL